MLPALNLPRMMTFVRPDNDNEDDDQSRYSSLDSGDDTIVVACCCSELVVVGLCGRVEVSLLKEIGESGTE